MKTSLFETGAIHRLQRFATAKTEKPNSLFRRFAL
jgi:hypothetical protein